MKKHKIILKLIVAFLLIDCGIAVAQQNISSEDIVKSLRPKSRTRSLVPAQMSPDDAAFLETMKHKTRGLTVEEKSQISTIIEKEGLASIDLEINFSLDSAKLDPSSIDTLQRLGEALKNPDLEKASFLVAGHTDARGPTDHNQALSDLRAKAVKEFLVSKLQVSPERLLAVGYGRDQLKNNDDPLAAENRRVKITNLGTKEN
jgi:outer membrane protein OmpA-like peptidoglycan-associated protein